jgi:hypothetical protein
MKIVVMCANNQRLTRSTDQRTSCLIETPTGFIPFKRRQCYPGTLKTTTIYGRDMYLCFSMFKCKMNAARAPDKTKAETKEKAMRILSKIVPLIIIL